MGPQQVCKYFAYLLLMLSLIGVIQSKTQDANIQSSDPRNIIPLALPFGFSNSGLIRLYFTLKQPQEPAQLNVSACSKAGFLLTTQKPQIVEELNVAYRDTCIFEETQFSNSQFQVLRSLDFYVDKKSKEELSQKQPPDEFQASRGEYSIMYANCEREQCKLDFEIKIEELNGSNHLALGEIPLPYLFLISATIYLVLLLIWCTVMIRRREDIHKIHYLMAILVLFKMLDTMSQSGMYFSIQMTGEYYGWNIAYYIFTFCRGVLFFSVIILISAGWSYMKLFLGDKERNTLMVIIPLQILANVAIIVMDEQNISSASWFSWKNLFYVLDVICCFAVLLPIIWQIKHLTQASKDDKLVRCLNKLILFRRFYVMVVVWIYVTRFVVYILSFSLPYNLTWLSELANQVAYILFYIYTGYQFRPHKENPYFQLQQQEVDDLVLDFEEDDLEENNGNVLGVREFETQGLMSKESLQKEIKEGENGKNQSKKQKKVEMAKFNKD